MTAAWLGGIWLGLSLGLIAGFVATEWMHTRVARMVAGQWQHVVAAQHAIGGDLVTQAIYGGQPVPARVEREETPEERLEGHISEDMIQRGVDQLREAYAGAGVHSISDEELREEAVMIASGVDPFGQDRGGRPS